MYIAEIFIKTKVENKLNAHQLKNGKINGSIVTVAYIIEKDELLLHDTIVDKS
jgi:hypothetical protein